MSEMNLSAIQKIDAAVEAILEAQRTNEAAQKKYSAVGTAAWHAYETVDDKLHDALAALGQ